MQKALAVAVLHLFRMTPAERDKLGANGRRYFKDHFDHDMLTEQLIEHVRAESETHKGG